MRDGQGWERRDTKRKMGGMAEKKTGRKAGKEGGGRGEEGNGGSIYCIHAYSFRLSRIAQLW